MSGFSRTIISNVAMQVAPPGGQTCSYMQAAPPGDQTWNQCKWHYMLAKFGTNTSGTTCWSNLEPMQVVFLVGEIYQVIESIPWVRSASALWQCSFIKIDQNLICLGKWPEL